MNRNLWTLVVLDTIFSAGHHVDHVLRHRAGWPVTNEVSPFTIFLAIYPVIAIGVVLTRRGMLGPGFWSVLAAIGVAGIIFSHFGPIAKDPPALFAGQYGSQLKGLLALIWVLLCITTLGVSMIYAAYRWAMLRRPLSSEVART